MENLVLAVIVILGIATLLSVAGLACLGKHLADILKTASHELQPRVITPQTSTVAIESPKSETIVIPSSSIKTETARVDAAKTPSGRVLPFKPWPRKTETSISCGGCGYGIETNPVESRITDQGKFLVYCCETCKTFVQVPIE